MIDPEDKEEVSRFEDHQQIKKVWGGAHCIPRKCAKRQAP